jgi:putative methionine-R-sulfoxide reductase with GAF domain
MKFFFSVLLICFSSSHIAAQSDSSQLALVIRESANRMLQSFKNKDFTGFVRYNNTNLVEMMGGENQFSLYLQDEMKSLKGVEFSEMKAGTVLQVVTTTQPMQCLVEQFSEIVINGNPVSSVSHLIGVSADAGKTWKFADANTGTIEEIKSIIPELSPNLRIPKKQQQSGIHLSALLKNYKPEY